MGTDRLGVAQAVCTRLCHDLGGPVGALSGALELLEGTDGPARAGDDALEVARDAARIIDRRLRFFRAAIGGVAAELGPDELGQLSEGLTLGRRATVDLSGLAAAQPVPPAAAQALLVAMWLAIESLPRGGAVRVGGDASAGLAVLPDGPGAAWPATLVPALRGEPQLLAPRGIAVPLLVLVAAAARVQLDLPLPPAGGIAPLVLVQRPEA